MRFARLPITSRLSPTAAVFLIPAIAGWAAGSLRLRSPLGEPATVLLSAAVLLLALTTTMLLAHRRRFRRKPGE